MEIITEHGQDVQMFIDDQQGQIIIITVDVEGATGQHLRSKCQLSKNRVARLALHRNQRADKNTMHASVSWLRVEERLAVSLLFFIRNNVLKIPNCLHSQLTHNSDTHTYPTRHVTWGLFTVPKFRTNSRKHTVLYRVIIACCIDM